MQNQEIYDKVMAAFEAKFGGKPAATAYAPGRIEVLGNHTDYNEGFVFSAAIDKGTFFAVSPADDDTVSRCVRRTQYKGERIGWSRFDEQAAMFVKSVGAEECSGEGVRITYIYKGVEGSYEIPFIDDASVENSIICAATALYLGLTPEELAERMPKLEPIAMRLEVKQGQRGLTLINDSYNSDINSLDIALDFMNRRGGHTLILSDI
jgi:alanine racemase